MLLVKSDKLAFFCTNFNALVMVGISLKEKSNEFFYRLYLFNFKLLSFTSTYILTVTLDAILPRSVDTGTRNSTKVNNLLNYWNKILHVQSRKKNAIYSPVFSNVKSTISETDPKRWKILPKKEFKIICFLSISNLLLSLFIFKTFLLLSIVFIRFGKVNDKNW